MSDADQVRQVIREELGPDLDPLEPDTALENYLESNPKGNTQSTLATHRSRLKPFIRWCKDEDVENLNDLSGPNIEAYAAKLNNSELAEATGESRLRTLAVFLQWAMRNDAVHPDLPDKIDIPTLAPTADVRDTMVDADQMRAIRNHLAKYEYASTAHVLITLLSECGMRISAVRALDTSDLHDADGSPYLTVENRPETGTRLKNGDQSERCVALDESTATVLRDYIDEKRPAVCDEYDRVPLLATDHGRISDSTIRKYLYMWTRPCVTGECPHDRDPSDCEAATKNSQAFACPSSKSPHAVRRGYITNRLDNDIPPTVLAERCDVSEDVMAKHYDARSDEQRMRRRRRLLDETRQDRSPYGN